MDRQRSFRCSGINPAAFAPVALLMYTYRLEGRPVEDARSSTPQVVIVDDDTVQLDVVCEVLADADIMTEGCPFDKHAFAFIRHRHPKIVILDVMMPFSDGLSIYRQLRTESTTQTIHIIFMTANPALVVNALPRYWDHGVHLLFKPFAADDVINLVTFLLS